MLRCERIEEIEDTRLDTFRSLKTQNRTRDARLFVAEGATVVERLIRSDFEVNGILISDRKWDSFSECLPVDVPIYRVSQDLARQIVGFGFHCGVVASAVRPPSVALSKICGDVNAGNSSSLILACDRVVDPENVGSLIRIASAFGASAVLLGEGSADPYSRRVLRVSMGNVLYMPVAELPCLADGLRQLQADCGFHVCATVLATDAQSLRDVRFHGRTVLLFGNEYDGVSKECADVADRRVTIPMLNQTDSLNVAMAATVFAYQFRSEHDSMPEVGL